MSWWIDEDGLIGVNQSTLSASHYLSFLTYTKITVPQVNEKPLNPEEAVRSQQIRKEKNEHKKFVYSHGITPPFKNVRKKRFRKTAPKKIIDDPEVEKEVL